MSRNIEAHNKRFLMYTYATVYNKYDEFLYYYFEAFGIILLENTFDLECKDLGSNFTRCLHTI